MDRKPLYIIIAISCLGFIIGAWMVSRSLERFKRNFYYHNSYLFTSDLQHSEIKHSKSEIP